MAGRPNKLTQETIKKLEQAIALGATYEDACRYAGINYETFRRWMRRGEQAKSGEYREFHERIRDAESRATIGWLAKIEAAANNGSWKAAAWKLERRYPDRYGRSVQRVEVSGPDGEPVRVEGKYEAAQAIMGDTEALAHASEIIRRLSEGAGDEGGGGD